MSDIPATQQDPNERTPAPLSGHFRAPGDKSISHRALILAAMATGTSRITGLLEGDDILATAQAMRQLGASVCNLGDGVWEVGGCGPAGFKTPTHALDLAIRVQARAWLWGWWPVLAYRRNLPVMPHCRAAQWRG